MGVRDTIQSDFLQSMKEQDEVRRSTLRMLQAALKNREIAKRAKDSTPLDEEEVIGVLQSERKKRREAAEAYRQGGRMDLAQKEEAEAEVITAYLPAELSPEEIEKEVREAIQAAGAAGPGDIGKVMAAVMPRLRGRADGSTVQRIVASLLKGQRNT